MLNSAPASKPLLLFHLLLDRHVDHALCFTKSIDAATRLVKLLDLFLAAHARLHPAEPPAGLRVASYSSDLPVAKRTKLLDAFKAGEIHLYVARPSFACVSACSVVPATASSAPTSSPAAWTSPTSRTSSATTSPSTCASTSTASAARRAPAATATPGRSSSRRRCVGARPAEGILRLT